MRTTIDELRTFTFSAIRTGYYDAILHGTDISLSEENASQVFIMIRDILSDGDYSAGREILDYVTIEEMIDSHEAEEGRMSALLKEKHYLCDPIE